MFKETYQLLYRRSKWLYLYHVFFATLGVFYFISMLFDFELEPIWSLSMSVMLSITTMLAIAATVIQANSSSKNTDGQ
ncbi:hypothetical protein IC617_13555 [Neiella sp. HB171785]|uniref:Uncharacterized protein n=1 Tax=Neiella litorisoli TaxID=2771431 RepID=A0A8J6QLL2_9GAMM|nr:hypothetical protein [Neiella litorisoli]MBD1390462.1 hypothetical protein [Neiella litorisoli]